MEKMPEPQKEHRWLHKLVGEWSYESDTPAEEGKPPTKLTGRETVRSLGGLWVLCEGEGDIPGGGSAQTLMTLGYDPKRGRYVGSWVASVTNYQWVYEGELDADERVLTLNAEGPSMSGDGSMAKYRDVITFESDDHRTLTAFLQDDDGQWQQFMIGHYRRRR
jgi:hypothetical protein